MVAHVVSSARLGLENCLSALGIEADGVVCPVKPAGATGRHQTIPLAAFAETLEIAARMTNRPDFGLYFAQSFDMRSFGALGHLMYRAPTVGHSLRAYVAYYGRIQSQTNVELHVSGDLASLSYQVQDSSIKYYRQDAEFSTGILMRFLSGVCGSQWRSGGLKFVHDPHSSVVGQGRGRYPTPFSVQPVFNARANCVEFPAEFLLATNPLADEDLADILQAHMQLQPVVGTNVGGFAETLRALLRDELLCGREIGIEDVTRFLGCSVRSLQRNCAMQGLSFRGIRNEAVMAVAMHWLKNTDLPVTEIALRLGFSETSSFSRACRNFSGLSPSKVRNNHSR
jgi:AraC-like DNA-binding protein